MKGIKITTYMVYIIKLNQKTPTYNGYFNVKTGCAFDLFFIPYLSREFFFVIFKSI